LTWRCFLYLVEGLLAATPSRVVRLLIDWLELRTFAREVLRALR
jgi:hypothetical protein